MNISNKRKRKYKPKYIIGIDPYYSDDKIHPTLEGFERISKYLPNEYIKQEKKDLQVKTIFRGF